MKEVSKTIKNMVMENKSPHQESFMKVISFKIIDRDSGSTTMQMEIDMKENGKRINAMAKESKNL